MSDKLCQGKIIHRKAGAARAAMRRALVEGRAEIGAKVYPCAACKGWHWGHSGGGRRAAGVAHGQRSREGHCGRQSKAREGQGMSDHHLMHGDCIDRMAEIPSGSVDLVLTDPPYGTTACAWDAVIPFEPMWREVRRILKPRGAAVFTSSQPFASALIMSNPREFRYEWIWEKTAATGFLNAKKAPLRAHENVLVFAVDPPAYFPQKRSGATIKRVNPSYADHGAVYGKAASIREPYCSTERYPRSVVVFPKDNRMKSPHPTQKPVALMEYLIRTYTNEGETVLDFTMGSGTTGVACANTGRRFIGIEKDAAFFDIASARIAAAEAGPEQRALL